MWEWIMQQGMMFYVIGVIGFIGAVATALANCAYKRLIKEADVMEKSENRLIKYIKLKYSSYYTLGLKANDEQAMIRRYMYRYKMGPASLLSWSKTGIVCVIMLLLVCLSDIFYYMSMHTSSSLPKSVIILASFTSLLLLMQYKVYDFDQKQAVFCAQMEDNLHNFLKNKIEYARSQKEKKKVQKLHDSYENAAATIVSKEELQDIDVKAIEEIFKEFLN